MKFGVKKPSSIMPYPTALRTFYVACIAAFSLVLGVSQIGLAQDTAPAPSPSNPETQESDQKNPETDKSETGKPEIDKPVITKPVTEPERYYLGAKPAQQRQKGPALGTPKNIRPSPYVPRGSLKIPAPANQPAASAPNRTDDGNVADGNNASGVDADQNRIDQQQADITPDPTLEGTADPSIKPADAATTPPATRQDPTVFIQQGELQAFDPSRTSIDIDGMPLDADFWDGYSRADYIKYLPVFAETHGSPGLRNLARKIAASGRNIPASDDDEAIRATIQARLNLFTSLGDLRGYLALVNSLPRDFDWSAMIFERANAYILSGNLSEACLIAEEQRKTDQSAYWLRLAAFCSAANGDRTSVDFQLGILEEILTLEPTFYRLIDYILFEAEQNASGVSVSDTEIPPLNGPLEIDILEAAMARLSNVEVNAFKLEGVNPLAVPLLLANPRVTSEAKTKLIQMAVQQGWIDGKTLETFFRTFDASEEQQQSAITLAASDASQDDGTLTETNWAETNWEIDATLANLVSAGGENAANINALQLTWQRAGQQNTRANVAPALYALAETTEPGEVEGNMVAVMAQLAATAGDYDASQAWLRTLRVRSAGDDTASDSALISLWPLMITSLNGEVSLYQFEKWWQANGRAEDRFERANLALSLIEALGRRVPEEAWQILETGPSVLSGVPASPAQWRRFLIAAQSDNKPAALAAAVKLLAPLQSGQVSASLAGSVLGTLRDLGFEDEAHRLALEILISQMS